MWEVRPARQEDHDAVVRLWESSGLGRTTEAEWKAIVGGTCASLLVAAEGGAVIGAAVAAYDGWRAFLYHVAVSPGQRRRGVAAALMDAAEKTLRGQGAGRIFALVNERMTDGLALCAAGGYEPEGDLAFVKSLAD